MFLETVQSEGLFHFSYVVGDSGKAAVIDPRRDCSVYLDLAQRSGARITHIFETHRNEDFLTGSRELSLLTAAPVYHGGKAEFRFGNPTLEGDIFDLGNIRLSVLETPGHTPESISIVLTDRTYAPDPIAVFTGDSLLAGGTGRTDLFPGKQVENAGQLYDSIFHKLLPLGDHVIMYSSHGGEKYFSIASERSFSTLGYERRNNPSLRQTSRDAFIALKTHEHAFFPPRCNLTLRLNLEGPPLMNGLPRPQPYTAEDFAALMEMGMYVVDTRSPEAVCGNYIPGTLAIPLRRLPLFAGWFIPPDHPIGLIVGENSQVDTAVRHLVRIGFESIPAYLASEAFTWKAKGKTGESIPVVPLSGIEDRRHNEARPTIIDVRTGAEYDRGHLDGAIHIFAGEIPERIETIPGDQSVIVYSGNGDLAVIAATLLRLHGIQDTGVGFGPLRT